MKYKAPTKAVIAAAGFGTRFLPQTKAMPKEMLPVVDKPIIQYVVESLVEAGIKDIIVVTGYSKRAIEDHFDTPNAELAALLQSAGKQEALDGLYDIANMATFAYVRQKDFLGNAAPLLYASHLINHEPFIYVWADEFVKSKPNYFTQSLKVYEKTGGSIMPCFKIHEEQEFARYGIVGGHKGKDGLMKMNTIAEKPGKAKAPSDWASGGGFLFTPEVIPYVERLAQEHDGEGELIIQTAIQHMIDDGHPFYAYEISGGKYYDTGNKLEYIKTVIDFALEREDIGAEVKSYLRTKLK